MATTKPEGKAADRRGQADKSRKATNKNVRATKGETRAKITNTTVRLSAEEVARLDRLAETYSAGDRSATIRHALRFLDEQRERDAARDEYLEAAREIHGEPTDDELAEMRRRYFS